MVTVTRRADLCARQQASNMSGESKLEISDECVDVCKFTLFTDNDVRGAIVLKTSNCESTLLTRHVERLKTLCIDDENCTVCLVAAVLAVR